MGKAKLVSKNGLLVSVLVFVATTAAILVLSSRFIAAPRFLLVQSVCHHPAPLIGPRVWQTIEADVIPRGSKDWDRVGILFDQWNNGNLQIDESHFYENRPEVWGQTGARQPGYAWFKFVTDPKDQKPVAFVPRAPPARVLLPWCERTVEKHIDGNPASDVSVCIIVRNEERALREWINYYLFLGVGRIAVYDDMSVDRTSEIARAYGVAVSYMKWEPSPKGWEIDQMDMYLDCANKERDRGAKWVGNLDVDEYLVFDDPNQKVDSFLHAFDRHHPNVGSVSFNWRMMFSDEVSLPDPAFTVMDVQYACSDRSDERHHVKTFVKLEAFRGVENPHFQLLKEGFRQYDVSGGIIDPPGPFASRSIPTPARINHYRLLSLHEWLRKASKRHSRIGGTLAVSDNSTSHAKRLGDYGYEHLEITLGNCFPTLLDGLALLNVLARQGCL